MVGRGIIKKHEDRYLVLLCELGKNESKTLMAYGFNEKDSILIRSRKIMDSHWEEKMVRKKKYEECY